MPRVAPVVVDGVEALDVFINKYPYNFKVAIGAVREARLMERRPSKLISGLQTRIFKRVRQQLHQMHRQRDTRHPSFYGYAVELLRL